MQCTFETTSYVAQHCCNVPSPQIPCHFSRDNGVYILTVANSQRAPLAGCHSCVCSSFMAGCCCPRGLQARKYRVPPTLRLSHRVVLKYINITLSRLCDATGFATCHKSVALRTLKSNLLDCACRAVFPPFCVICLTIAAVERVHQGAALRR